jgi:type II secretory pathway pseudopilin PulG
LLKLVLQLAVIIVAAAAIFLVWRSPPQAAVREEQTADGARSETGKS